MQYQTLYDMWSAGKAGGELPDTWRTYRDFMCWANENKYKVEYGFKGGFTIQGCLAAIPQSKPLIKAETPEKPALKKAKKEAEDGK